jgi:hypothetical protein
VAALPEWPILIQDAVVDTPHSGDPAGVCRLKYDRKVGGEPAVFRYAHGLASSSAHPVPTEAVARGMSEPCRIR